MRTLKAARSIVLSTGILTVGASLTPARATCSYNVDGSNIFALAGDVCTAHVIVYNPPPTLPAVPPQPAFPPGVSYTGFGFFAYGTSGSAGEIDAPGPIAITTTAASNAYGMWSYGAGGLIDITGLAAFVQTSGNSSDGFFASNGGVITSSANAAITTTGLDSAAVEATSGGRISLSTAKLSTSQDGSPALYATGTGSGGAASSISASGFVGAETNGFGANGVAAEAGATVSLSGGGEITTNGNGAYGVIATGGGLAQLSGSAGTLIDTAGNGSGGIGVYGAGSEVDATNVSIATLGGYDSVSGYQAYGAYNAGGVAKLIDTSVTTQGNEADGVLTSGGSTTIVGGSITTSGAGALGVAASGGGSTTLNGATVATSGQDAHALSVTGAGSQASLAGANAFSTTGDGAIGLYAATGGVISATGSTDVTTAGVVSPATGFGADGVLADGAGATVSLSGGGQITTKGNSAYAVVATGGGLAQLNGSATTSINTTGDGAGGVGVYAGSEVDATNVSIVTQGGYDSASGYYAYGVYNAGGVAKLTDTSVTTQGGQTDGVLTSTGGSTTIVGGSITTSGAGALGVAASGGASTTLNGATVATSGQDAHALSVTGGGSQASLAGANTFSTTGGGAIGLYARAGGVISATGSTNITTAGGVSLATGFGAEGVVADGAGSHIKLAAATIATTGPGSFGLFASDATASGSAGSIAASGTLAVTTTSAAAAAVGLQGNGASIVASGGGTIASAGDAIEFLGGTNQTATFDDFSIANPPGDLVFADGSRATVNFNHTTANAGASNLIDAVGGSVVTLYADASNLTGAIRTDSASTTNVNLAGGSTWSVTGPSTVANLVVTNSAVVFAPPGFPGAFKTLTVGSYAGSGASLTMNAMLGGAGSTADELVINGGKATGSTAITINNVGGTGGQTTGNGIPIVIVTNGGATAANAFFLTSDPVVGGYKYVLQENSQDDWSLVSFSPATQTSIANSVASIAKAQQRQIVTSRVLGSILLGATEQVSCSNCSSGFGSFGSYALGTHGRWSLSDQLTLMGGFSYDEYSASGVTVSDAPAFAGSLVYDPVNFGKSRPFLEAGGGLIPYEHVQYLRGYSNGLSPALGSSTGWDRSLALFGRIGWVARVTPIDEGAVYADISRNWLLAGAHSEGLGVANPYPASVPTGLDTLNVAHLGAQWTHLFGGRFEANVSAGLAYGFQISSGPAYSVYDNGIIPPGSIGNSAWFEYGARVGYRAGDKMVIDAFLLGTAYGIAGYGVHGGVGLRYLF